MAGAIPKNPLLWIIAGPNGSGKSTYYEAYVNQRINAPFVNADSLALELYGRHPETDKEMLAAARQAEQRRQEHLAKVKSFVMETVFSHESKLALITQAKVLGYMVRLSVIATANPLLNVARVEDRVGHGGHPVPTDKIVSRYERTIPLLAKACRLADWAVVLDNSSASKPFQKVLAFEAGTLTEQVRHLPKWASAFMPQ